MKKIISLFLSVIVLSLGISSSYCQVVEAASSNETNWYVDAKNSLRGLFSFLGEEFSSTGFDTVFDFYFPPEKFDPDKNLKFEDFSLQFDSLYADLVGGESSIASGITLGSNGFVSFSNDAIVKISELLSKYKETNLPDVVWMPVISASEFPTYRFYSLTQYYQFRSYADDKALTYVCASPHVDWFKMFDFSNFVIIRSKTVRNDVDWQRINNSMNTLSADFYSSKPDYYSFYLSNRNGVTVDAQTVLATGYDDSGLRNLGLQHKQLCYNWDNSFDLYLYPMYKGNVEVTDWWSGSCNTSNGWLVCSASEESHYIPIFSTTSAYKQWVTGQSDYYRVTPTYDGGDITINPNADYSKVYNNITTTIQNNYADGKDYSDILAAIQLAYAESMKEISAGLDDIGGNTEEANSWLEQIKKNTDALIDPDGGSWLARIYEQETAIKDSIDKGFADLLGILSIDDVDDPGGTGDGTGGGGSSGGDDSGGGGSNKTFWSKLGDFASGVVTVILDLISTVVFKAMDGLDYLLGILMDNIGLVFTEMALVFGRLNNAMIVGNGFYASIYGHMPEVARDMIAYLTFCFVCAAVIRTLKE